MNHHKCRLPLAQVWNCFRMPPAMSAAGMDVARRCETQRPAMHCESVPFLLQGFPTRAALAAGPLAFDGMVRNNGWRNA